MKVSFVVILFHSVLTFLHHAAHAQKQTPFTGPLEEHIYHIYSDLVSDEPLPTYVVFRQAYVGFLNLKQQGALNESKVIGVVDFTKPSYEKRFWVIDLVSAKVLLHTYVSHGRNSGLVYAEKFSNTPESYQSSLGFYVTGSTYVGKHGRSLYLHGQEQGINHNAKPRAIVMHSAEYVTESFIKRNGRAGRSLGCPAVPPNDLAVVLQTLPKGSCLYLYHHSATYAEATELLDDEIAFAYLAQHDALPTEEFPTVSRVHP